MLRVLSRKRSVTAAPVEGGVPASAEPKPEPNPTKEMPFTQHLEELRWHILRALIYLVVLSCLAWHYYDIVYKLLTDPLLRGFRNAGVPANLTFLHFIDPLLFRLQIVLTASVVVGLPLLLWEIWRFVAPGLYTNERRYVGPLLPFSILLCLAGIALVYFALPIAIEFLLKFMPRTPDAAGGPAPGLIQDPQRYFFFFMRMMVGAGIAFQTPIVILLLGQLELVTARGLLQYWRHSVIVNFTIAAIVTPTIDPFNMSIIGVPLCLLYFLSVILVWFVERGRARAAAGQPVETPAEEAAAQTPLLTAGDEAVEPAPSDELTQPVEPEPPAPAPAPTVIDRAMLGPLATGGEDAWDE